MIKGCKKFITMMIIYQKVNIKITVIYYYDIDFVRLVHFLFKKQ